MAKGAVFISVWASVTAELGMRDVAKTAGRIRLKGRAAVNRINAVTEVIERKRENR